MRLLNVAVSAIAVSQSPKWVCMKLFVLRALVCRHMPEFKDCSFEGVLDKGTLDAILCGEKSAQHAAAMLAECFRCAGCYASAWTAPLVVSKTKNRDGPRVRTAQSTTRCKPLYFLSHQFWTALVCRQCTHPDSYRVHCLTTLVRD